MLAAQHPIGVNDVHTHAVRTLDFRRHHQVYRDQMRGEDRVCRMRGRCVACARQTFGFDDGENDPRGPLGLRAVSELRPEEHGFSKDLEVVVMCWGCSQERERYDIGLESARRRWRAGG